MGSAEMLEATSHVYETFLQLKRNLGQCEILVLEEEEEAKNEGKPTG